MKNNNKGFTLVEILIVVAIIAILAGVAFTGLSGVQGQARDTTRIANLEAVRTYLEAYNTKCGHYPGIADTRTACNATIATWGDLTTVMSSAGITTKLPNDPIASRNYYYGVDTTANQEGLRYVVGAWLEKDSNKLRNAPTGTVFGVECDHSSAAKLVYCITSD
jgi:prepilin-type N-terminal cleavage/methylation domain-containing protein